MQRGPFDLVLMDVHMPGMDGPAAAAAIRRLPLPVRDVAIVAVTSEPEPEVIERCLASGVDEVIGKPVKAAVLLAAMKAAFEPRIPAEPRSWRQAG